MAWPCTANRSTRLELEFPRYSPRPRKAWKPASELWCVLCHALCKNPMALSDARAAGTDCNKEQQNGHWIRRSSQCNHGHVELLTHAHSSHTHIDNTPYFNLIISGPSSLICSRQHIAYTTKIAHHTFTPQTLKKKSISRTLHIRIAHSFT